MEVPSGTTPEGWIVKDSRNLELVAHPSTETALAALGMLTVQDAPEVRKVLDVGCGSGLLAMTAARLWPECRVIASDIHARAVADTKENVEANGFAERIECIQSHGLEGSFIKQHAPYDIIVSNLLAEYHIRFARSIREHVREGGAVILSGVLAWLSAQVEECYTALGFTLTHREQLQQWSSLTFRC